MRHRHAFITIFIILNIVLQPTAHSIEPHPILGSFQPNFRLPDLNGTLRTANDWPGKILVINFWATWCIPCRKEIPLLNQLQKTYQQQGVQFIDIAIDNANAVGQFIQKIPIEYPVLIGDFYAADLAQQYGNQAGALPYTVFVNREGKITTTASGALNKVFIRRNIDKLP